MAELLQQASMISCGNYTATSHAAAGSARGKSKSIMASSGMFWFITLAVALGIQAKMHSLWWPLIVGEVFAMIWKRLGEYRL
jgi:Na+-driven multidrug efflux pump